jgi:hypothetical protein
VKRATQAFLALLLVSGTAFAAVTDTASAAPPTAPDRRIVLTVANPHPLLANRAGSTLRGYSAASDYEVGEIAEATIQGLEHDYGLRPLRAWPIAPLKVDCVVFEVPPGPSLPAVLMQLQHDPRVRLVQPLQTFSTLESSYNDPYYSLQRGFAQIHAAEAQQHSTGEGVRIAVIDTGVDVSHPDLSGRILDRHNFVDNDAGQFLRDRHGTEVTGIIAAVANNHEGIVGVAPGARVLALKACWQPSTSGTQAQCNSFTLAQALDAAIRERAQIINLSLGGPPDPLLAQLLAYGIDHGAIVVGAVPANGQLDGFPLGVPGVLAVDSFGRHAASARVLHAPGSDVLTLTPQGHYDFASGSSLAAAHISGVIALLLGANPHLDPSSIGTLLSRASMQEDPTQPAAVMVDACAAMDILNPYNGCMASARARSGGNPALAATAHNPSNLP